MDYINEILLLKKEYEEQKNIFYQRKGKKDQLDEQKKRLENEMSNSVIDSEVFEKVRVLLQKTADYAREQSRIKIEALVTNCLQYIFDSSIEFKIEISESRGRPEAEFFVVSYLDGEMIKMKPHEARGGGVVDIISIALRLAMLQCSGIDVDGPIILDEPAKHVSDEYVVQTSDFLKQISTMFNRQVIMVTHNKHLSENADNCYRVSMIDEKSVVLNDS